MLPPSASYVVLFVFFKKKEINSGISPKNQPSMRTLSDGVVREWCRKFKDERTVVHDEERQGCKSVTTEDIVQQVPGGFWSSLTL
ncbi:hypothetical protein AVEN_47801-1 [Araneus ventricosus]|uniref:Mos1 transposase HTH domain-containing protein n=1 Tax=Araneus ventricosus TaxID=182803 RepID=A0A4Y2F183_ARAVE|nr:hypothetical protein AVEN_231170-1 [Araneus ventricosus]GBM34904.1 hypothetical protein AVEN_47801-1 [Araneus ventricosus]